MVLLLHPHAKTLIRPFAVAVLVIVVALVGEVLIRRARRRGRDGWRWRRSRS